MNRVCLYILLVFLLTTRCYAIDLMDVYHQALENDPTFKSAYSKFMAQSQNIPEAWAPLLPQLTIKALVGRNGQLVDTGIFVVQQTYNGNQWRVNASQTLFNYQAWSQVQQAKASVKAAMASFNNAAQELILRTTTAYFNLLLAKDTLAFAEAKKKANQRQLYQAQARFNVGLSPITAVYEAKAAYDLSVAQVISSQNKLMNENQNLSKITNHLYENVASLRNSKIPLIKPEPNDSNEWVATGLKQNYNLFAAKFNLEAARQNIKARSAGNWPTFAIQGNTVTTHFDTPTNKITPGANPVNILNSVFVPRKHVINNVEIAMNFPVFQGGLVIARTKKAVYNFQVASEQLEKIYREVVANSTIAFNTINDGINKIKADRQTVFSQQNSLSSVDAQYQVGTRTMTDVVTAQQHLFQAQEQLARDQYGLIKAILRLKYLAGTLNVADLEEINAWLATTRVNGLITEVH